MNCACMHVLTVFSNHFLVEYCRGRQLTHFECWLMGRLSAFICLAGLEIRIYSLMRGLCLGGVIYTILVLQSGPTLT